VAPDLGGQLVAEHYRAECGGDRLLPGRRVFQHVLEQLGQVQDLDAVIAQGLREDVVLLLRPRGPGQPGEEQLPGIARQHPFQLGSRPVHDNRPEPAHLTVHPAEPRHRPVPPGGRAFPVLPAR
jgi:hypothetical protein